MIYNNTEQLFGDSIFLDLNRTNSTIDLFTDYFNFTFCFSLFMIFILLVLFIIQYIALKYYLIISIYNGTMAHRQRNI